MSKRTFEVRFAVEEHSDTERKVVTIEGGVVDGASPRGRAVAEAANNSPYTHVETLAIEEVDEDG